MDANTQIELLSFLFSGLAFTFAAYTWRTNKRIHSLASRIAALEAELDLRN